MNDRPRRISVLPRGLRQDFELENVGLHRVQLEEPPQNAAGVVNDANVDDPQPETNEEDGKSVVEGVVVNGNEVAANEDIFQQLEMPPGAISGGILC